MIRVTRDEADARVDDAEAEIIAEINITPLTDVFLVLLIIFMVGASIAVDAQRESSSGEPQSEDPAERGLQVRTPQGSGDEAVIRKDVVIAVMPDGAVFVDGEAVPTDQLSTKLAEAAKRSQTARVVVRGDENASYRAIMDVINVAESAGLTRVALSTRQEE